LVNRRVLPVKRPENHDPAKTLLNHAVRMAAVFCGLILIAAALEYFSKVLVMRGLVEPDSFLLWSIKLGSRALVVIDLLTFVCVVARAALRLFRSS
jgi:hypothetical protein